MVLTINLKHIIEDSTDLTTGHWLDLNTVMGQKVQFFSIIHHCVKKHHSV